MFHIWFDLYNIFFWNFVRNFLSHQNGNNSMKCSIRMVDLIPFEFLAWLRNCQSFYCFLPFSDILHLLLTTLHVIQTHLLFNFVSIELTKLNSVQNVLWWDSNWCDSKQYAFEELLSLVWNQSKHVPRLKPNMTIAIKAV